MGVVYKAHDPTLDRTVAIKVLAPHLTWDQEFVQRFLREARAAARLKHPHIATIYEIDRAEGHHFIAMEYLKGWPLSTLIRREGPLPPRRAAHILSQIARAVDHAHTRGVIHRDIKPGNVIVGPRDHAMLTDFGVAKAIAATQLTHSGTQLGTPAYMSPEQIKGEPVGRTTDVYALGVVAYEMLGGRPPFEGDTHRLLYAHVHEQPPPLRRVTRAVQKTVLRALEKKPEKRWGSAGAFAKALARASQKAEGAGLPLGRWAIIGGAALAVTILLIVTAFAVSRFVSGTTPAPTEPAVAVAAASTPAPVVTEVSSVATAVPTSPLTPTLTPLPTQPVVVVATVTPASPTATSLPTFTSQPTDTLVPTRTSAPTRTPTRAPTATLLPTRPSPPTRFPTSTPISVPTSMPAITVSSTVTLVAPQNGARLQGDVTFQWSWPNALGPGELFDVRVCKGEGCSPQFGKTNVGETTWLWRPDEGGGTYRWQVVVIDGASKQEKAGTRSAVWRFDWNGGSGQTPPTPQPTPTR